MLLGGITVDQCQGCEKIIDRFFCSIWNNPAVKWKFGKCPSATHIKREVLIDQTSKRRVGQQKSKKKKK